MALSVLWGQSIQGRSSSGSANGGTIAQTATANPAINFTPKSLPKQVQDAGKRPDANTQGLNQEAAVEPSATELLTQGKSLFRSARFKQALEKFEAALKQEPENDEALALAAETAFRLDSQAQSREYFLRRADLPRQKDSVKAYCYDRMALSYWRDAHDIIVRDSMVDNGRLVYRLPEQAASEVSNIIKKGLEYVDRTLAVTDNFAEAYNIRNLLYSEAALSDANEKRATELRSLALEALRRAIEISELSVEGRRLETADFTQPTIRISEFARTKEDEEKLDDPMLKRIEGGRPIKRVQPFFPSVRLPKPSPDQTETTAGASQTAASTPSMIKIEVLISTTGEVVFTRPVDGRSDLSGAAIIAARGWRFEPAKFEGKPVQVSGVITFEVKQGRTR
jgi:tetratricopeptide (TPR) repeat protein